MSITDNRFHHNYMVTESESSRAVITKDELLRLEKDCSIVLMSSCRPLKVLKFVYTEHPLSKRIVERNPAIHIPTWRRIEDGYPLELTDNELNETLGELIQDGNLRDYLDKHEQNKKFTYMDYLYATDRDLYIKYQTILEERTGKPYSCMYETYYRQEQERIRGEELKKQQETQKAAARPINSNITNEMEGTYGIPEDGSRQEPPVEKKVPSRTVDGNTEIQDPDHTFGNTSARNVSQNPHPVSAPQQTATAKHFETDSNRYNLNDVKQVLDQAEKKQEALTEPENRFTDATAKPQEEARKFNEKNYGQVKSFGKKPEREQEQKKANYDDLAINNISFDRKPKKFQEKQKSSVIHERISVTPKKNPAATSKEKADITEKSSAVSEETTSKTQKKIFVSTVAEYTPSASTGEAAIPAEKKEPSILQEDFVPVQEEAAAPMQIEEPASVFKEVPAAMPENPADPEENASAISKEADDSILDEFLNAGPSDENTAAENVLPENDLPDIPLPCFPEIGDTPDFQCFNDEETIQETQVAAEQSNSVRSIGMKKRTADQKKRGLTKMNGKPEGF